MLWLAEGLAELGAGRGGGRGPMPGHPAYLAHLKNVQNTDTCLLTTVLMAVSSMQA